MSSDRWRDIWVLTRVRQIPEAAEIDNDSLEAAAEMYDDLVGITRQDSEINFELEQDLI